MLVSSALATICLAACFATTSLLKQGDSVSDHRNIALTVPVDGQCTCVNLFPSVSIRFRLVLGK